MKIISLFLCTAILMISFTACMKNDLPMRPLPEYHTEYEGVYLTIDSIDEPSDNRSINAVWHNESEANVTYGVGYFIEISTNNGWISVMKKDFPIIEIACSLEAGETNRQSYKTEFFDLSKVGTYRLRCEFYVVGENTADSHETWVKFEVLPS